MNRRNFLTSTLAMGTTAASAATIATHRLSASVERSAITAKSRDLAGHGAEVVSARLESLEQRFDQLEHHHKNLVRVGALALTLSTGIDVLTLL